MRSTALPPPGYAALPIGLSCFCQQSRVIKANCSGGQGPRASPVSLQWVGIPSTESCPELLSLSKEQLHNHLSHFSFLLKTSAVYLFGGRVRIFCLFFRLVDFLLSRILLFPRLCDVPSRLFLRKTTPGSQRTLEISLVMLFQVISSFFFLW